MVSFALSATWSLQLFVVVSVVINCTLLWIITRSYIYEKHGWIAKTFFHSAIEALNCCWSRDGLWSISRKLTKLIWLNFGLMPFFYTILNHCNTNTLEPWLCQCWFLPNATLSIIKSWLILVVDLLSHCRMYSCMACDNDTTDMCDSRARDTCVDKVSFTRYYKAFTQMFFFKYMIHIIVFIHLTRWGLAKRVYVNNWCYRCLM